MLLHKREKIDEVKERGKGKEDKRHLENPARRNERGELSEEKRADRGCGGRDAPRDTEKERRKLERIHRIIEKRRAKRRRKSDEEDEEREKPGLSFPKCLSRNQKTLTRLFPPASAPSFAKKNEHRAQDNERECGVQHKDGLWRPVRRHIPARKAGDDGRNIDRYPLDGLESPRE
ncbi:MAG: hypothetical protein Greene041679_594, partial [Parcubacteria group bacterium Greene0416_79]